MNILYDYSIFVSLYPKQDKQNDNFFFLNLPKNNSLLQKILTFMYIRTGSDKEINERSVFPLLHSK